MADFVTHATPLPPGYYVAVFPYDDVSGATIGYHGSILSVIQDSYRRHPGSPNLWRYRVNCGGHTMEIQGCDVVPLGDQPRHSFKSNGAGLELRFETDPDAGSPELRGTYRLPTGELGCFVFRRRSAPYSGYQWHLPTPHAEAVGGLLEYEVAADCRIDRALVLRAFVQILKRGGPADAPPAHATPEL